MRELEQFISDWKEDTNSMKPLFQELVQQAQSFNDAELDFKARPGISYSLRVKHKKQTKRTLFVLIDIIDDQPSERWLSVCFYADLLTSPEEDGGDIVPGGLMGEDACCFDIDEADESTAQLIKSKLAEAYTNAVNEK